MKLKKLKEETPKYEGKFWSYSKRKFVNYTEWMEEETPCAFKGDPFRDKNKRKI